MILSENEAFLLASGYTFDSENIRIPLKKHKILNKNKIVDVYLIDDMEAAKKLYKKYEKTYRRRLNIWKDEFIDNTLIVQILDGENNRKI